MGFNLLSSNLRTTIHLNVVKKLRYINLPLLSLFLMTNMKSELFRIIAINGI